VGLLLSIAVFTVYTVVVGGPSGNPARFIAPLLPLLLAALALRTGGEPGSEAARIRTMAVVSAVVLMGLAHLWVKRHDTPWQDQDRAVDSFELVSRAVHPLPEGTTVVFQALGRVGWENRHLVLIDPLGLTNKEVARNGEEHPEVPFQGHRKWMSADQFFALLPDVFIPFSRGSLMIGECPDSLAVGVSPGGPDAAIMNDARFARLYRPQLLQSRGIGCCLSFARQAEAGSRVR
jgi:hypothetical protein